MRLNDKYIGQYAAIGYPYGHNRLCQERRGVDRDLFDSLFVQQAELYRLTICAAVLIRAARVFLLCVFGCAAAFGYGPGYRFVMTLADGI
jgi:hypothetical protein